MVVLCTHSRSFRGKTSASQSPNSGRWGSRTLPICSLRFPSQAVLDEMDLKDAEALSSELDEIYDRSIPNDDVLSERVDAANPGIPRVLVEGRSADELREAYLTLLLERRDAGLRDGWPSKPDHDPTCARPPKACGGLRKAGRPCCRCLTTIAHSSVWISRSPAYRSMKAGLLRSWRDWRVMIAASQASRPSGGSAPGRRGRPVRAAGTLRGRRRGAQPGTSCRRAAGGRS